MLRVNGSNAQVGDATLPALMTEYTLLTKALASVIFEEGIPEEYAWNLIDTSVNLAKMSSTDIKKEVSDVAANMASAGSFDEFVKQMNERIKK